MNHQNLGFSESDIKSNNSLIVDMCVMERKNYDVVMVPIISPYRQSRKEALMKLSPWFYEIYFSASLDCVRQRDVKGLYAKARAGVLKGFTGIDDPFEEPQSSELNIDTTDISPEQAVQEVMLYLEQKGLIK